MSSGSGTDIPQLEERVLSTLNKDGSRRWMRPWLSQGRFLVRRRVVGYALIVIFALMPWLRIGGKPPILLDIPAREFTFFGATFLPTDTLLLALLFLSIFVTVFLVTALLGRIWCGWGCPQTVYMELVYRPVERFWEGRNWKTGKNVPAIRRIGKYATFLVISFLLANTFIAYFVGTDALVQWVRQSPFEHPTPFMIMAFVTGLMMLDFCVLREQVCTLMCPYGRFQSVMLDRQSLIISYDETRGDPKGRLTKEKRAALAALGDSVDTAPTGYGDCIECTKCVTTCPTGIDIRDGLQMECIGCAQCIDACDSVMDAIGRPRGLIRYSSQEAMETGRMRLFRPRVVIYPIVLAAILALGGVVLAGRQPADVRFLRSQASAYQLLDNGDVSNLVQIKITNRAEAPRTYNVALAGNATFTTDELPMTLAPMASGQASLRITTPRAAFRDGRADVEFIVTDGSGYEERFTTHVPGPLFGGGPATRETSPAEGDSQTSGGESSSNEATEDAPASGETEDDAG